MPNVLVEPNVPLETPIGKIKGQGKIPNFTSKLFFFDNFILPSEAPSRGLYPKNAHRRLFTGNDARFLSDKDISVYFACAPNEPLGHACLTSKRNFEEGILNPAVEGTKRNVERFAGVDVFVSERLAMQESNANPVLTVEFVDGIPIPPRNWSYEGILNFKEKYDFEYRNFWNQVSLMAADCEFLRDDNPEKKIKREMLKGLEEYALASAETFGTRIRDAISFQFTPAKTTAFIAAAFGPEAVTNIELPLAYSVVMGACCDP